MLVSIGNVLLEKSIKVFSTEAATRGVLWKKVFLEISQNSQENTCTRVSFFNFIKKEALAQVFSCEFCKISKNTYFTEHLWSTASGGLRIILIEALIKLSENAFNHLNSWKKNLCNRKNISGNVKAQCNRPLFKNAYK